MFSSTSEGENSDTDGKSLATRRSGRFDDGGLPKLVETLALCYLGVVLMRLPVSLAQIYRWAIKEELIYTRAVSLIRKPNLPIPAANPTADHGDTQGDARQASGSLSLRSRDEICSPRRNSISHCPRPVALLRCSV